MHALIILKQLTMLFFTVQAAVYLILLIREEEYLRKLLLDGGDASGVLAMDHIGDLLGKLYGFLLNDLAILDDIDGDVVIDITENIKVYHIETAFDLQDVLAAHLAAACVLDDRYLAVKLIEL